MNGNDTSTPSYEDLLVTVSRLERELAEVKADRDECRERWNAEHIRANTAEAEVQEGTAGKWRGPADGGW